MDQRYLLNSRRLLPGIRSAVVLACIAGLMIAAVGTHASVYLRWGAAENLARFVAGIGGTLAYQTNLIVNGRKARMSVYGLPASSRSWANSVKSVSYQAEDAFTSLTGLTLSGTPLLFQYQRQTYANPTHPNATALPRFPQSTQAFSARAENTDMTISISRSPASPAQVRDFYRAAMQADGWHTPLSPLAAPPEGMTVFIREQEVACVAVEQVRQRTETRITVLHKRLNIK